MLDEVQCTGTEPSLASCRSLGWRKSNCRHDQDAGVVCTNGELQAAPPLCPSPSTLGAISSSGLLLPRRNHRALSTSLLQGFRSTSPTHRHPTCTGHRCAPRSTPSSILCSQQPKSQPHGWLWSYFFLPPFFLDQLPDLGVLQPTSSTPAGASDSWGCGWNLATLEHGYWLGRRSQAPKEG